MRDERAKAAIDRSRNGSTGSAIMAQLLAAANIVGVDVQGGVPGLPGLVMPGAKQHINEQRPGGRDDHRRRECVREVRRREESRSSVILASTRHARLEHCRQLHLRTQPQGIKPLPPAIRPGRCSREGDEAPPEGCSAEPGGNAARQEPVFPCCQFVIVSYLLLVSTSCSEPRLETLGQTAAT